MERADFHLPGLFEFFDFYKEFLALFHEHRELFHDWVNIASIYGAPADCIWSGGRFGSGYNDPKEVLKLLNEYGISGRLTFSNSLLSKEHLSDKRCNELCAVFESYGGQKNGVIVHSDVLLHYLKDTFPGLYLVSSTTKVLTDFEDLKKEINRPEFSFVVPDFRHNNNFEKLDTLNSKEKEKLEFLCNEGCLLGCTDRKACYESISRKMLDDNSVEHICSFDTKGTGYLFSKAMDSPAFIGVDDIKNKYLPGGFKNFKIEGRNLGTALVLEFLLYYLAKPEAVLRIREMLYLDSMLDLF